MSAWGLCEKKHELPVRSVDRPQGHRYITLFPNTNGIVIPGLFSRFWRSLDSICSPPFSSEIR